MVDGVSGSVNQTGSGNTYVTGIASGLDTNSLIEAAYNQKLEPAVTIDEKVEANAAKVESYNELMDLITAVEDSLDNLTLQTGSGQTNAFDTRTGSISSSDGNDPDSYISVALDDGAADGEYEIEIVQTAEKMRVASDSQSSEDDALGLDGVFSLNAEDGTATEITVTSDMSLSSIASAINAVSSTTGVTAMVVLAASGEYQISLSSVNEAMLIEAVFVSGGNVLQSLGVLDEFGDFANVTQSAQQSVVNVDGVQYTRDSNTIDDVIAGVTLDLKNAASGVTLTLTVESDTSAVKDSILDFVDAYNNLREFILNNQQETDSETGEDTILFADRFLRSLSSELGSALSGQYGTDALTVTLRDIGITYDSENYLEVDESTLDDALLEDLNQVASLFESQVSFSDDSNIQLISYNNTNELSFTLDIEVDTDGNLIGASANGDSTAFTVKDTRIIGAEGTIYEGLTFSYIGDSDASIGVEILPGMADLLADRLSSYTDEIDGVLRQEISDIENANTELEEEADRIRERADIFLDKEIDKYSKMESDVLEAENLQKYINEILGGSDDDE